MNVQYHIELTIGMADGPRCIARFFLGNDREQALAIFRQLNGTRGVGEAAVITLDFLETCNGLPLSIEMIGCTLDELGENCQTITRELFKYHALSPLS